MPFSIKLPSRSRKPSIIEIEGQGLTPATRLAGDLELGRFGRMKVAIYLEESFDVELPDEAVDRFDTVGDTARYMSRWLS
jgi:acyl carrier protein